MRSCFCSIFCLTCLHGLSQNFLNGILDGDPVTWESSPYFWEWVPFDDPANLSSSYGSSSPDFFCIGCDFNGNPYAGTYFMSGNYCMIGLGTWMQEGIMQEVSGFVPGYTYQISFFQTVVKQSNLRDTSGSPAPARILSRGQMFFGEQSNQLFSSLLIA